MSRQAWRQEALIPRLPASERKVYGPKNTWKRNGIGIQVGEPALGTLDQRLSIVLARLGRGRPGFPYRASKPDYQERDYLENLALRAGMSAMVEVG